MFTVLFVMYPGTALGREEALRYWAETHGPIAAKVPGVRRYVQLHAVAGPDGDPPFLGTATIDFDDEAAFHAAAGTPEMEAAVQDVANFADPERLPSAFVQPVTIVG
jgi:uncharacterized protein (TIGR02118 family)